MRPVTGHPEGALGNLFPGREGRAPLRLVAGDTKTVRPEWALPGREGRAPLRPGDADPHGGLGRRLFPAVRAGLHCGGEFPAVLMPAKAASSRP